MGRFDEMARRARMVADTDDEVERKIAMERKEKSNFLRELIAAAMPALDAVSSAVPRSKGQAGVGLHPSHRGLLVAQTPPTSTSDRWEAASANWLFLGPDGSFFGARVVGEPAMNRIHRMDEGQRAWKSFEANYATLTVDEVVDARWPVNEITEAVAKALEAQRDGLVKKDRSMGKRIDVLRALAELLRSAELR